MPDLVHHLTERQVKPARDCLEHRAIMHHIPFDLLGLPFPATVQDSHPDQIRLLQDLASPSDSKFRRSGDDIETLRG